MEDGEYQTFSQWLGSKIKEKLSESYTRCREFLSDNTLLLVTSVSLLVSIAATGLYFASFQHRERFLPWLYASAVILVICTVVHVFKSLRKVYKRDMEEVAKKARRREEKLEAERLQKELATQLARYKSKYRRTSKKKV